MTPENSPPMLVKKDPSFVFILGSPRSGTTLLGHILDQHDDISQWYEPNFVWDRHFRNYAHDERTVHDASPKVSSKIYSDFVTFKRRMGSRIIVDKSPRNSLRVPFIQKIFPQARFIYITRDGRDVTLSINKQWILRRQIIQSTGTVTNYDHTRVYAVVKKWLNRQPILVYKMRALWFETHGHVINKSLHLNRLRWRGHVGWGPRFKDWQHVIKGTSLLQFNAYQWAKCTESIQEAWDAVPSGNKLMISYEDLLKDTKNLLTNILRFLDVREYAGFFKEIPELKKNNFNKWKRELSKEEILDIHPIVTPMLVELGYEPDSNWC